MRDTFTRAGRGVALLATTILALAPPPALAQTRISHDTAAAPSSSIAPPVLQVGTGRGRLITLPRPITDVFVASDTVADVQVRSPTQIYVFGKAAGETTISATSRSGGVVYAATVRVGNNFDSIQQMLNLAMPEAHVTATTLNGVVLLTGTVAAPADAQEAQTLVQAFVGDGVRVLSRLRTATPLQVNLQVRFAEVSRTFVRNIGANLVNRQIGSGAILGIASGRGGTIASVAGTPPAGYINGAPVDAAGNPISIAASGLLPGATQYTFPTATGLGSTLGLAGHAFGMDLLASLDLGERLGQVSTLANPNLTALSGETGTFLAGGEIPIPVSQGLGAVSVEYKQYGVSLAYTPTVLSDGRISLRVRPEVSELSSAGAVTINGTTIPALTTRRAETTVELGSGQSFMIAGLLSNSHDNSINRTPGLGQVPILGQLFRSEQFQRNETELVIIITPYLVHPVNGNDIALPTDGERAPTELDTIITGQLGGGRSGEARPVPHMARPSDVGPAIGASQPLPSQAPATVATAPAPVPNARQRGRRSDSGALPGFSN